MKMVFCISLLVFSVSTFAADDSDIAAVYTAIPSARTIDKSPSGYRVTTDAGKTVFVNKTPFGYRVSGDKSPVFINKTAASVFAEECDGEWGRHNIH